MIRLLLGPVVVATVVAGSLLPAGPAPAQPAPTVDLRCEHAASDVPQFGGAYLEGRVLHVWLTEPDGGVPDAVRRALREQCPEHDDVVVRAADYPYAQLRDWQEAATGVPDVTMAGIDARANRVTVGVADPDRDGAAVLAALATLGVPAEAVVLQQAGPFRPLPVEPDSSRLALGAGVLAAMLVIAGVATALLLRRRRRVAGS